MKAVLSKVVGGPETLVIEDIPAPELRPGWARVKVKAVGINFPDVLIIEDKYQSKPPRPFAPGGEVSGIVSITILIKLQPILKLAIALPMMQ